MFARNVISSSVILSKKLIKVWLTLKTTKYLWQVNTSAGIYCYIQNDAKTTLSSLV